ncbi:MAG TPA: helix-turn-helix domain-containing protein [Xanthomonadales bacterium]|nr:helix-turn-helix domain-containing protein [Xanthomonadales bacterium]
MTIVYLLASIQALFLAALLAAKSDKELADRVLMVWLTGIGLHTGIYFLVAEFSFTNSLVLNLNAGFPFLQGPFLLTYIQALVGKRSRFTGLDILHLLPFLLFSAYMVWLQSSGTHMAGPGHGEQQVLINLFSVSWFLTLALFISAPVYIAWSLLLMHHATVALGEPEMPLKFRWIRYCIAGLGIIWIATVLQFIVTRLTGIVMGPHLVFGALTLFVYGLGYLGLTRTSVFREPEMVVLRQSMQPKYRKSGLGPEEAKTLHQDLTAFMDSETPWLDGDLSLQGLAEAVGMSPNNLSQVINDVEKQSFRDFINARRIEGACQRLDQSPHANLLELALSCGFNSKSSFNRAFKKFTGKTPSQYIKGC